MAPALRADTRQVLVFRALMLGDLLCATPALRALRQGLPKAHISLVGLPWASALCARLVSVDEFIEFPGWPGLPERPHPSAATQQRFVGALRERRADLALQLHGSGSVVNPLVAAFGAASTAGFAMPGDWPFTPAGSNAADFVAWPETGSEVERLLTLTDHLGLPRQGLGLDFPLRDADRHAAAALRRSLGLRPFVLVHPGSQLPSRRWPAERFAAVADSLADTGLAVVLTGSAAEAPLARQVAQAMRTPALVLAGQTTLWTLGALVEQARLVLSNDTGVSHIAAALNTPSVVVASGSDVARWAPAQRSRHRVLWHDLPCRPCAHAVCPIGHPCALGVDTAAVQQAAHAQLQACT